MRLISNLCTSKSLLKIKLSCKMIQYEKGGTNRLKHFEIARKFPWERQISPARPALDSSLLIYWSLHLRVCIEANMESIWAICTPVYPPRNISWVVGVTDWSTCIGWSASCTALYAKRRDVFISTRIWKCALYLPSVVITMRREGGTKERQAEIGKFDAEDWRYLLGIYTL